MSEKEQAIHLMDKFIDLQRIKAAGDKDKEIEYQLKTTKAKLGALGIGKVKAEDEATPDELEAIREARQEIERRELFSHEEVWS